MYAVEKVKGHPDGAITIDTAFEDGTSEQMHVDESEDVEIPGENDEMAGYTKRPRNVIDIIVETNGKKAIHDIKAKGHH